MELHKPMFGTDKNEKNGGEKQLAADRDPVTLFYSPILPGFCIACGEKMTYVPDDNDLRRDSEVQRKFLQGHPVMWTCKKYKIRHEVRVMYAQDPEAIDNGRWLAEAKGLSPQ